ncbi:MAG: Glycine betaine ABC transport system, permease protein OpuAB [uncultured Rubrobacteraceae bacterium]|uniref:Glycine betaine ABC transport system, permease protein OpuAB n=1 Tax=uncultured Rubrobacteraceae bacterium TaxID=349277 RepID=A0A6J4QNY0_9ACTN|nr:MAG: Glycine betaine ABC transport system, permease protein OpuAB [uncultured Rubrobacteraceae bacterium]
MFASFQQNVIPEIPLDNWTDRFVDYVQDIEVVEEFFDLIKDGIGGFVGALEAALTAPPQLLMVAVFSAIALFVAGWRVGLFSVVGFLLIISLGLWDATMLSLALVLAATVASLLVGVPIGVLAAKSKAMEAAVRPTLDIMQTMPAFVYLVPMVVFLGLGGTPALVATVIFAAPPAVRLTMLGIQQVPKNTVEAAHAFGATPWQTLRKVELPQALPTIMAGVNQVIMLALSMVVIAALVGAGGLGEAVVRGLSQLDVGRAFVGGVGIVIIAIYLDRVTRPLGGLIQRKPGKKGGMLSKVLPGGKKSSDVDPDTAGTTGAGAKETVGAGTR